MSHFKSQQNIIEAFVRISLFILMKCREVFLSLSHIPPVSKQRGLEENFFLCELLQHVIAENHQGAQEHES